MVKIIDCFIFYNELDLLTYRLNLLDNVVDYFVIVESTHTFVGKEKQLFFNDNKHLFEKFNAKIIHIIVDDFPNKYPNLGTDTNKVWENEYFQRDAISRGINCIKDLEDTDMIIISDLDEIPDPNKVYKIKSGEILIDINCLQMDLYYYNLNTKFPGKWSICKVLTFKKYKELNLSCSVIRNITCPIILNGGWHLSYFGDKHFVQNKIQNFSHQEYNSINFTELSSIEERINNSKDLYGREDIKFEKIRIEDNIYLPPEYDKYLNKYYN